MKRIFNFLTPTKILIIFLLFIISVLFIYQIDSYKHKQIKVGLIFLYFIPGLFVFTLLLIYNLKRSIKESNLKNKIMSGIPLLLISFYFLYFILIMLIAEICYWLGIENPMG